jgi:cytochrome c-type biogenesis protein CcmE
VTSTLNDPKPSPASDETVARTGPALPTGRRRSSKRLWFVFAVLAAAFVFLIAEGLGSSLNFYDTVTQALARKDSLGTSTFRIQGYVVRGSIHPTAVGTDFAITQGHHTVAVTNTGSPPQLFQPGIGVVVQGHFASRTSTNFVSDLILVKHSANYAPAPAKKKVADKKGAPG